MVKIDDWISQIPDQQEDEIHRVRRIFIEREKFLNKMHEQIETLLKGD